MIRPRQNLIRELANRLVQSLNETDPIKAEGAVRELADRVIEALDPEFVVETNDRLNDISDLIWAAINLDPEREDSIIQSAFVSMNRQLSSVE